jgi:hypothetical protein
MTGHRQEPNPLLALEERLANARTRPARIRRALVRGALVVFGVLLIVGFFSKTQDKQSPAPQQIAKTQEKPASPAPLPAPETAEQKAAKAKKKAEDDQWAKEVVLVSAFRSNMKNSASFKLEQALRVKDGTLCLTYRGTNSFNAIIMERAVIDTKTTGASTDAAMWNKRCGGKSGIDISYIRHAIF